MAGQHFGVWLYLSLLHNIDKQSGCSLEAVWHHNIGRLRCLGTQQCTCLYLCLCTCPHTCLQAYQYSCSHTCMHTSIQKSMEYTQVQMHIFKVLIRMSVPVPMPTRYTHIYTHACTHTVASQKVNCSCSTSDRVAFTAGATMYHRLRPVTWIHSFAPTPGMCVCVRVGQVDGRTGARGRRRMSRWAGAWMGVHARGHVRAHVHAPRASIVRVRVGVC